MGTWEERMAHRQVDHAHAEALQMHEAESRRAAWSTEVNSRFSAFAEARGGSGGYNRWSGAFAHVLVAAHGNAYFDAATGENLGVFSIVLTDDMPAPLDSCPICDDFRPEDWRPPAEGSERSDPERK